VAQNPPSLRRAHADGRRDLLGDVRPDLPEAFVPRRREAIDADPARRFASPGELERALATAPRRSDAAAAARTLLGQDRKLVARPAAPPPSGRPRRDRGRSVRRLPAAASYEVEAALYRDGTAPELLLPGAVVAVGDALFMKLQGSRALYVYVINRDESGQSVLLFRSRVPRSRIRCLQVKTTGFPPADLDWSVTSAGGREHMVVVVSPERPVELEAEALSLPQPQEGGTRRFRPRRRRSSGAASGGLSERTTTVDAGRQTRARGRRRAIFRTGSSTPCGSWPPVREDPRDLGAAYRSRSRSVHPVNADRRSTLNRDPRERFSATADLYARWRPGYPAALRDFLLEIAGLEAGFSAGAGGGRRASPGPDMGAGGGASPAGGRRRARAPCRHRLRHRDLDPPRRRSRAAGDRHRSESGDAGRGAPLDRFEPRHRVPSRRGGGDRSGGRQHHVDHRRPRPFTGSTWRRPWQSSGASSGLAAPRPRTGT